MCDDPCFTIVSYNICGLNNELRVAELHMFLARHTPSILIIQEPKIDHRTSINKNRRTIPHTPKQQPKLAGYASIYFKHPVKPTGIIFYIHESCTYMARTEIDPCTPYRHNNTTTTAAFVWISSPLLKCPIVVGGIYLDAGKTTTQDVITLKNNITRAALPMPGSPVPSPPLAVYVLGDFNARHVSWEQNHADQKVRCNIGINVHRQLVAPHATRERGNRRDVPLTLINTMFTTSRYVPTRDQTGSVIDLALTTHPHTVGAMHVMSDSMLGSDHWPIMISIPRSHPSCATRCLCGGDRWYHNRPT